MNQTDAVLEPIDREMVREDHSTPLAGMHVLVLTSGHHLGDARVYARHAHGIRNLGAEVTMVGAVNGTPPVNMRVIAFTTPRSRWERFAWQPWRCIWSARREPCDIVHFHDAEVLTVLPLAKLIWPKAAFVYDVHEDFSNLILIRDWLPVWMKPAVRGTIKVVERTLSRLVDGVVGVTPPLTNNFDCREKQTAFNFPAHEFYQAGTKLSVPARLRKYDLVHLGTLSSRRASFLCDILEQVYAMRPSTQVLLIGVRPNIAQLIRGRIPNRCVILGSTKYEEIPKLLCNSRVGLDVHPWDEPHLQVALPVKVFEYMAAGCAIVCSSMPVLDRILEETGMVSDLKLLRNKTVAAYTSEIIDTLEAIDAGNDPGTRLRTLASQHLVWEREARKIATLYLNLLSRRNSS